MFFTGLASSLLPFHYFITIFGLGKRFKKITRPLYVCSRSIHFNICYYHQDLQRGRFTQARARGCVTTPAPSYSSRQAARPDGGV